MCSSSRASHGPASIQTIRLLDEYEHELLVVVLSLKGAPPGWLSLILHASAVPVPSSSRSTSESGDALASISDSSSSHLDQDQGHTTSGTDRSESDSPTPDASHSDVRKEHNRVSGTDLAVSRGQGADRTSGKSLYRYGKYERGSLQVGKALVALNTVYDRWVDHQPVLCRSLLKAILQIHVDFCLDDHFGIVKSLRYGTPHLGIVSLKEYIKPSNNPDRLDLLLASKGIGPDGIAGDLPGFGVIVVGIDFPSSSDMAKLKNRNGSKVRQRPVDVLGEFQVSSGNMFGTARHVQSVSGLGIGYGPGRLVNHQCTHYTVDTKWQTLTEPNAKSLPWYRRLHFRVRKTLDVSREVTWRYDTGYFGEHWSVVLELGMTADRGSACAAVVEINESHRTDIVGREVCKGKRARGGFAIVRMVGV